MAVTNFLDRGTRLNPQGKCLIGGDKAYSYDEVQKFSYRTANKLLSLGLGKGAKGAILSINDPTAYACLFGIMRAGMVWVPVNPKNNVEENQYIMDSFDCEILFFHSTFSAVISGLVISLPKIRHFVCIDKSVDDAPFIDDWFSDVSADAPHVSLDPADLAMLSPTGGTTGRPKGVQISHRNLANFAATYMAAANYDPACPPVNLAAAPLTHAAGVFGFPVLAQGGTIIIMTAPDIPLMLNAIEKHRVTDLFLPPTVIYRMLEETGIETRDFSSLKYFVYGAAPMSVDKLRKAITTFGPVMTQVFGQTEAPCVITIMTPSQHMKDGKPADDNRLSSCGFPTPLVDVAILDEGGRPLGDNEPGEICVKGDLVMTGYYKNPEATAAAIVDGWLHTGDVAYRDTEGFIHIVDRKKDMIITGGFNVFPQEVEQVIWSHSAVQDCAVIGVPDEKWGEAIRAVVELNPGESVSDKELIALCKEKIGSVKAPKAIDFVELLPRSSNGKVLKRTLRDQYWQGQARRI